MYNAISEEMLNFFAGVNDFHNLIGHPVNQYRMNYKGIEKLREAFFRRVNKVSEVEKFVDYYKWFDDSIAQIIQQLIPASADYTSDILNTIESHVLERNKYQYRIPMIEFTSSTEALTSFAITGTKIMPQKAESKKIMPIGGSSVQNEKGLYPLAMLL